MCRFESLITDRKSTAIIIVIILLLRTWFLFVEVAVVAAAAVVEQTLRGRKPWSTIETAAPLPAPGRCLFKGRSSRAEVFDA